MSVIFQATITQEGFGLDVRPFNQNKSERGDVNLQDLVASISDQLQEPSDDGFLIDAVDIKVPGGEIYSSYHLSTTEGTIHLFQNNPSALKLEVVKEKIIQLEGFNLIVRDRRRV